MFAAVGAGPLTEWVDGRRRGPLHYAASHGRAQTCLWLMGHGAHAFARDLDGRAPIHLAAAEGHEDALRALLNHPAARPRRPDPVDRLGRTPLHDACWRAQKYTAEALLRNGASVAARDAQGFTPIERASQGRRTALVEYLTRQQIIPLDYNLTFTQYHTYDEHKVVSLFEVLCLQTIVRLHFFSFFLDFLPFNFFFDFAQNKIVGTQRGEERSTDHQASRGRQGESRICRSSGARGGSYGSLQAQWPSASLGGPCRVVVSARWCTP